MFKVSVGGGVSLAHDMVPGLDGIRPEGGLVLHKDGVLWGTARYWDAGFLELLGCGTTSRGGRFDAGTIFRLRKVSTPPGP